MAEIGIAVHVDDDASSHFERMAVGLENIKRYVDSISSSFAALGMNLQRAFDRISFEGLTELERTLSSIESLSPIHLTVDTGSAADDVAALESTLENMISMLDDQHAFHIDNSQALAAVADVTMAIESVPAVTYRDVILRYHTEASPVMPFTEGIEHIHEMMGSLPSEGSFKVRFTGEASPEAGLSDTIAAISQRMAMLRSTAEGARNYLWSDSGMQTYKRSTAEASVLQQTLDRLLRVSDTRQDNNVTFSPTININAEYGNDVGRLAREIDVELANLWKNNRSELRRTTGI